VRMLSRRARVAIARRPPVSSVVLAGYVLVAFLYFGLPLLVKPGSQYVGQGSDPEVFIWAFAWWPHAILHGLNPFVSHAVWTPQGINLTWTTMVPGLALLFSPLTLVVGPVGAYNVAAVLMPALAAWTAFLLCRYLTGAVLPSLVGGYVFGFSSYVVGHAAVGHLNLTSVFLLPLVALVVLRFLDDKLSGVGVIVRLGPMLAFELLVSTEISLTLALALAIALVTCFTFVPARRCRLRSLLPQLGGAYVLAGALTEPFVYYLVAGYRSMGLAVPNGYVDNGADLANFITPPNFALVSWRLGFSSQSFPGLTGAQETYIGLPTLFIIALLLWERRRTATGRFLLACFALALLAVQGAHASILEHRIASLPWKLLSPLPLFEIIQPERLSVYVSLVAGVAVALWTAGRRAGQLRGILLVLAVLSIAASPIAGAWTGSASVPEFFTSSIYRGCLDPGENILPLPIGQGSAMLWQTESQFRFTMAGGYTGIHIPSTFFVPGIRDITTGLHLGPDETNNVRAFIKANHVTTAVVAESEYSFFSGALNRLATPQHVGGVVLYHFENAPPSCPAA
jgi:hypothetical protein